MKLRIIIIRADRRCRATMQCGQGISAEFLPHVFERLSQADASPKKVQGGLGLGLAIVKSLTEMHGGTVRVKSAGEGKGSTFLITLPVSLVYESPDERGMHHPGTERAVQHSLSPHLAGVSVLVVDDDADALEVVKRVLVGCGARVTTAASAADAMEVLRRGLPDMVLTDIGLPQTDGYDFVRQVRASAIEGARDLPIAALTAFARSEDRRQAMLAGFDIHLAKPAEPAELVAVIGRLARLT